MYPYIRVNLSFAERDIPTYGLCALLGFAFFVIPAIVNSKKKKEDVYSRLVFLCLILIFGGIGAVLLFTLTNIPYWIEAIPIMFRNPQNWIQYIRVGLVYYGGFFGIFAGMTIYAKMFHEDVRWWLYETTVSIPGFHVLGRIGCLLSGCCYGKIVYEGGVYNAYIDKYCIPIQLYEAIGEFFIFIIILIRNIIKKDSDEFYKPLGVYCVLYSALRFILEFWRGDEIRGLWGPFSTSQYISLILFPFGFYCILCPTVKNFLNPLFAGRRISRKKTVFKE